MANNHRSDILFFFGVILALWVAYSVRDVLMLIYVSALFAVVLSPAIGMIQKIHLGSWRAGRGFAELRETRHSGAARSAEPGIHFNNFEIPGSRAYALAPG